MRSLDLRAEHVLGLALVLIWLVLALVQWAVSEPCRARQGMPVVTLDFTVACIDEGTEVALPDTSRTADASRSR